MRKPTYEELERRVEELKELINLKVYPQNMHFETRDLIYFRLNRKWRFDFFDRKLLEITGYDSEDFHNRKTGLLDIVIEEDEERLQSELARGLESGKFFEAEFRLRKRQGHIIWVKMRGPIFCDDQGEFLAIQGIMDDITDRKNMEIALQSEHQVFTWVANSMEDGIYIVSQDYRIKFMNKALVDLVGDHVGEICYEALFNRNSACPWSVMDTIRQEMCGFQEYHFRWLGKTFQVRSFPIKSPDGSIGKLGQLKDITKTRKLEDEIHDYALRHQSIVDAANMADLGIFLLQDYNGMEAQIRYANEAFCRITGYDLNELVGMQIRELVHPDSKQKVLDRYRRRQRGETVSHAYAFKMVRKNGVTIDVFASVALSTFGGRVTTIGFLQDFTSRKQFQRSLWLSQRLASIGRLAAEVAHEINNPLTSILTFGKLIDRIFRQEPFPLERIPELRQFIDCLGSEATRCAEIARNLLDFSRHGEINLRENNIHEVLGKTLDILKHRAQMSNIRLEVSYGSNVPRFTCDFKRLQQAFMNLFWNAMEAMPEGGALSVSTTYDPKANVIVVIVSDTGTGIPEESLESIFEPFFTTKPDGKGVGLGLSVAYGIIRRHNGKIHAQSDMGKGTRFTIEFPLNDSMLADSSDYGFENEDNPD